MYPSPPPLPHLCSACFIAFLYREADYILKSFYKLGLRKTKRLIGTKSQFFLRYRLIAPLLALYPQFWGVQHVLAFIFPKSCFPESVDQGI